MPMAKLLLNNCMRKVLEACMVWSGAYYCMATATATHSNVFGSTRTLQHKPVSFHITPCRRPRCLPTTPTCARSWQVRVRACLQTACVQATDMQAGMQASPAACASVWAVGCIPGRPGLPYHIQVCGMSCGPCGVRPMRCMTCHTAMLPLPLRVCSARAECEKEVKRIRFEEALATPVSHACMGASAHECTGRFGSMAAWGERARHTHASGCRRCACSGSG